MEFEKAEYKSSYESAGDTTRAWSKTDMTGAGACSNQGTWPQGTSQCVDTLETISWARKYLDKMYPSDTHNMMTGYLGTRTISSLEGCAGWSGAGGGFTYHSGESCATLALKNLGHYNQLCKDVAALA